MPKVQYFRGDENGWADLKISAFGTVLLGVIAIKYDEEQEEEVSYGQGSYPQGLGYGNVKYTGSIKMRRWQVNELLAAAAASGGGALSDIALFPITVISMTGTPFRDVITCKMTKTSRDLKQGDKLDEVEAPLTVVNIEWDVT